MLISLAILAFGQEHRTFLIDKASAIFSAKIQLTQVSSSDRQADPIEGAGTVTIMARSTGKVVQTIRMPHLAVFESQLAANVTDPRKQPSLYDDEYSVVFQDFNFDGRQDLAICNGTDSGYGGPSYDVFLYDPATRHFVKSTPLTKLSSEHLGLIEVDTNRRELVVYDKDGAAWHKTSYFKLRRNLPVLVQTVVDDATGTKEIITTSTKVGKRWKTRVRRLPLPLGD